jgi:transposase-like protein
MSGSRGKGLLNPQPAAAPGLTIASWQVAHHAAWLSARPCDASAEPGAVASEVAREAGIHTSQLFRSRRELCERAAAQVAFQPVVVVPAPEATNLPLPAPAPEQAGTVEIELRPEERCGSPVGRHLDGVGLIMAPAKPKRRRWPPNNVSRHRLSLSQI